MIYLDYRHRLSLKSILDLMFHLFFWGNKHRDQSVQCQIFYLSIYITENNNNVDTQRNSLGKAIRMCHRNIWYFDIR